MIDRRAQDWCWLRQGGQDGLQFVLEPGVQNRVGRLADSLDAEAPRGRVEQGQLFGCPSPGVLVGISHRRAIGMPVRARVGDGLEGSGFVLSPHRQDLLAVGGLNQGFFATASGSYTVTTPCLRFRTAVPVSHQLRSFPHRNPASCRTRQMVKVLTVGSPSGTRRKARWSVVSDQVAVPSCWRWGDRRASRRMRSCSTAVYRLGWPPPCRASRAASPRWLKRLTKWATASPLRRPARRAASVKLCPSATASNALARATSAAGHGRRPAQPEELPALLRRQGPQRVFLAT